MGIALIAPARPTATPRSAAQLLFADKGERGTKLFVLDDRALRDLANFVEGPIRHQCIIGTQISDILDEA